MCLELPERLPHAAHTRFNIKIRQPIRHPNPVLTGVLTGLTSKRKPNSCKHYPVHINCEYIMRTSTTHHNTHKPQNTYECLANT
eukprot:gene2405-1508_t